LRIAIYHNLPSGGAKRTVLEQVKRLSIRHEVDVFSLSSANHEFADLRPYIKNHTVLEFRPLKLLQSPWGRVNQAIRWLDLSRLNRRTQHLSQIILKNGYDVLLAHPCQFENNPSVLQHVTAIRTVYYCHEPLRLIYEKMPARPYDQAELRQRQLLNRIDPLPSLYKAKLQRQDRDNIRMAARVLVNSNFIRQSVKQIYGIDAHVSYHGVDGSFFQPRHIEKLNILLSVGSLTPLKGFDFLIQAMGCLPTSGRPTLVIASNFQNPPEREYLIDLAGKSGVDVELEGNVSDVRLVELYSQAKITVYAPLAEPFGLVPLESMACATPVVAVDEGGIRETVLHNQTGVLVQRAPELFAGAITQLLTDTNLAREIGVNGREHVLNHWSWERAMDTLERYLVA